LPKHFADALGYSLQEVPGITADYYLILWSLAWDVHALTTAPERLFHGNILHPSPFSLAYSEHFFGNLPLFAPAYLLSGDPVVSVNTLIATSYVSCMAGMYILLRHWTGRPAAILGSLAFTFTNYRYNVPPYVYFLCTFYLPLAAVFIWRWLESRRACYLAGFSCAIIAQMLVSYYLAYATVVVLIGFILATAFVSRLLDLKVRDWVKLGAALALAALVSFLIALPYFELRHLGIIPSYDDPTMEGVATLSLIPYFAARRLWGYWRESGPLVIFVALAGPAVLLPRRGWRWPLVVGIFCCAAGIILSFGPSIHLNGQDWWSPYRLLAAIVPGFGTMRQPLRFILVFEFGLAILVGLAAERVFGRRGLCWTATGAVFTAWLWMSSTLATYPVHFVKPSPTARAAYDWLAQHGEGRPVIEIPRADFTGAARRMFLSTIHWSPIAEGYSGYFPRSDLFLYDIANRLSDDSSALQELVDYADIGWLLVHLDEIPREDRGRWENLAMTDALELAFRSGDQLLYRVRLGVRDDRRTRLFSRETTLQGTPLAVLEGPCPGRLQLVGPVVDRVRPRSRMSVQLDVRNDSSQTWPARGLIPRHLVRVRRALLRGDGGTLAWRHVDLPSDVPPGGSVLVDVETDVPAWPGTYVLRLELEQVLDRPFSSCGVEPLVVPFVVG
jgi:hypothetical protein